MNIAKLSDATDPTVFGGKAANLGKMLQAQLPVPDGFAIGLDAFDEAGQLLTEAVRQTESLIDPSKKYAVRSSALAEDAANASWAGLFETYLDTAASDVTKKIEDCHNSAKTRAQAYADKQRDSGKFDVCVVVQEMLEPEYAGVLFTKDPVTGADQLVTEYVEGLGEKLVSGQADPKRLSWKLGDAVDAPFDITKLTELAQKVEQTFSGPQDIEWVWADNKMWLVQTRPITTDQSATAGYYIGEPDELFYWGPSRGKPMYMSDFMEAVTNFFLALINSGSKVVPPKTLVLFHEGKMVWLNNAQAFADFTEAAFAEYSQQDRFASDYEQWLNEAERLAKADAPDLVDAWYHTLFAEFSLYGSETVISKQLSRFDDKQRQQIWGAFTYPDKDTFMNAIDKELWASKDPAALAGKHPWINDGYGGVFDTALDYFTKRLKILDDNPPVDVPAPNRGELIEQFKLSNDEVANLNLARQLAEFQDERKAWMMRTRRNVKTNAGGIEHGWYFGDGHVKLLDEPTVSEFWRRYVNFKASTSQVQGVVASNGGRHFVSGEVRVINTPTDNVEPDMILVVPATSPSYVPLMRKARALVTDHGGMMSHAAIVGREFNLPCIVGTKQGTKVLKDGDQVVLDMVKGEVIR